ncbi:hypothetical protein [Helicobacter pametensis]|nr:hypothetical protein [Helicobacter pametensis]
MQKNDLLLLSSVSPILYGIYTQSRLVRSFESHQKTLDALVDLHKILESENVGRIFYARGPGSFTAIKLTHIFLQTLKVIEGIELFCTDSFFFNKNAPIKAFGNRYFQKQNENIVLESFSEEPLCKFMLPEFLDESKFDQACEPLYVLPAV